MPTSETRNQDSTAIVIVSDDAGVIGGTPDWERPFTEYDHYGKSTGHDCVQCPVCGAEILDDETLTVSRRPAYRYE